MQGLKGPANPYHTQLFKDRKIFKNVSRWGGGAHSEKNDLPSH